MFFDRKMCFSTAAVYNIVQGDLEPPFRGRAEDPRRLNRGTVGLIKAMGVVELVQTCGSLPCPVSKRPVGVRIPLPRPNSCVCSSMVERGDVAPDIPVQLRADTP